MQSFNFRLGGIAFAAGLMGLSAAPEAKAAENVQPADVTIVNVATPHDRMFDIEFVGSRGWAVGDYGVVMRSDDGGVNWEQLEGIGSEALLAVDFVDKQRGVIVGTMGTSYYTEDGGDSWVAAKSDYSGRAFNADITESGYGIAVGEFGAIIRTDDLGHSWSNISPDYEKLLGQFEEPHFYDVHIDSQGFTYLFGEFNTILKSEDRGDSWAIQRKGDSEAVSADENAGDIDHVGVESLFSAHFVSDNRGWAVGQSGLILTTEDGGTTWAKQSTPTDALMMDIFMSKEGEGAAIGMRSLIRTKDFGKTWYRVHGAPVTDRWYQALAMGEAMFHKEGHTDETTGKSTPSMTTVSSPVYAAGFAGLIIRIND